MVIVIRWYCALVRVSSADCLYSQMAVGMDYWSSGKSQGTRVARFGWCGCPAYPVPGKCLVSAYVLGTTCTVLSIDCHRCPLFGTLSLSEQGGLSTSPPCLTNPNQSSDLREWCWKSWVAPLKQEAVTSATASGFISAYFCRSLVRIRYEFSPTGTNSVQISSFLYSSIFLLIPYLTCENSLQFPKSHFYYFCKTTSWRFKSFRPHQKC